ncbi:MAG TPA: DsbA family protein [Pyrinomonadaceae bacterium]|jgi:protein-disulfide isomerase|nr:DsbA family protein [Pyrinomonadaceae bacterium]
MKRNLPFIIIGVVLLAAIAAAAIMFRAGNANSNGAAQETATANVASPSTAQRTELPGAQPPHTKGEAGAPVVLEEFGDYQCPPCGNLHPVLQKIEDDYGARVSVVFRNMPLQQIHKNAFAAARAAEAASLQGKFWQMHDMIYETQKDWKDSPEPRPTFTSYASRLGLDVEKFKADMDKTETSARIVADIRRAASLGVTGTPTMFLNGKELTVDQTLHEENLRKAIDEALAAKTK